MRDYQQDFPLLAKSNGKKIVYLDSAATTHKPQSVIDAITTYYKTYNANPNRGAYALSVTATEMVEGTRDKVKHFLGVDSLVGEIVFTKSATEALNLLAYSYGLHFIEKGDEILISIEEHHSNLIPWQRVAEEKGAILKYIYLKEDGTLDYEDFLKKINAKTKLLALTHVSNVLGFINPIEDMIKVAKKYGTVVVIDGTQAVPHLKVNLKALDPDFYVFSGHKVLAPMGIGVLYGKKALLEKMPPFLYGGGMVEYVEEQSTTYAEVPTKFEGGTQNVEAIVGLNAAIDYIEKIGISNVAALEEELLDYALKELSKIPYVKIYGTGTNRAGILPFNIEGVHAHDVASILGNEGICIRAGSHCAQPLLQYLDISAICRASFYLYNTKEEVDYFIAKIKEVRRWLGYES